MKTNANELSPEPKKLNKRVEVFVELTPENFATKMSDEPMSFTE